ncbi:MAG: glycosyltransferase family 4 protein [Lachnospiraceae bacterium]|nr:glycosyltransferase family 4 protein [Lachnospiraceae bacterium]
MRILFLFQIFDFDSSTIYLDLVRECRDRGHAVSLIAGTTASDKPLGVVDVEGIKTVYMPLQDQFGAGSVKKALIQMSIPGRMKQILKDGFGGETFDVIAYPTPPITLSSVLKYCKKHYKSAVRYLMLKDIFPQNAVDLGMFSGTGLIYRYYRQMEKQLYQYSDRIGCMSEANVEYIKKHDPEIPDEKLEYFPNTAAVSELTETPKKQDDGRLRIVFGGNMGRPQDIEGLIAGIKACGNRAELNDVFFFFVGDGSESGKIEDFIKREKPGNFSYRHRLPREEYEQLLNNADAGLISLSADFTIPNFPSRLLSYMQKAKPVLAVVDEATDIDTLITEEAGCGYAVKAGDPEEFVSGIRKLKADRERLAELGLKGRKYFERYFNVGVSVDILERAYRG